MARCCTGPSTYQAMVAAEAAAAQAEAVAAMFHSGTGSPEGVVVAPVGAIYLRDDGGVGTTLYVKEADGTGNTGWDAK